MQIKTYPARQFEGSTQEFISTYFFEAKAKAKDNYKSIVRIFASNIYFPCAAYTVFSYLIFFYSELIAKHATLYLKANGERSNMNSLKNTLPDQCKNDEEDKQEGNKSERKQKLDNSNIVKFYT